MVRRQSSYNQHIAVLLQFGMDQKCLPHPQTTRPQGITAGGSDGEGGGGGRRGAHASFLAGEKGASFAKAFAKIITKPVKPGKAPAAGGGGGKGDVILAESAGVQKRKAEEEGDAAARSESKRQRLAMRKRGHLVRRRGLVVWRMHAVCGRLLPAAARCLLHVESRLASALIAGAALAARFI